MIWRWPGVLEGESAEACGRLSFFLFLTRQHTAFAEAPPTAGDSGASTRRLVGSERCSWMQRSASAGGGRSTHTIAGTRFPLSSARRSAASCVGWHSTAGTHTSVSSSSPDPDSRDPVRGVQYTGIPCGTGSSTRSSAREAVHQREPPRRSSMSRRQSPRCTLGRPRLQRGCAARRARTLRGQSPRS